MCEEARREGAADTTVTERCRDVEEEEEEEEEGTRHTRRIVKK